LKTAAIRTCPIQIVANSLDQIKHYADWVPYETPYNLANSKEDYSAKNLVKNGHTYRVFVYVERVKNKKHEKIKAWYKNE
jgi:hypothetical protein